MNLFDVIERTDLESAQYAESIFAYMNRTARFEFAEVRAKLELWFSNYPPSAQSELKSRFRSDIDLHHQSAFFELLLHELLLKLGCQVTLHPTLPNTTKVPDFLVEPAGDEPFYMEAVTVTNQSENEARAKARIDAVYDVIDRKVDSSNFFLWADEEGVPMSPPKANEIAAILNKGLAELDPDEVAKLYESNETHKIPLWRFEHDGWVVEFRPTPKKPTARNKADARPIGAKSTGIRQIDYRTPLRDSIKKKAGRYGNLNIPYVIAINVLKPIDEINIMEALFGREQIHILLPQGYSDEPPETRISRVQDGAWTSYNGPRNTRVSAVLIAKRLSAWNLASGDVCLYHHPWAQNVYSSVLTCLSQAIPVDNHLKRIEGISIGSVLGIPDEWPIKTN